MADKLDLVGVSAGLPILNKDVSLSTPKIYNLDGWKNVLSGMGTTRDKRRYTTFDYTNVMDTKTLSNMYMGDGLAARIIDTFADDMTREWGKALNDPTQKKTKRGVIESELERLDAPSYINQAIKWARLFGGALLYIGAIDGQDPATPLNFDKVKSVEYLRIIELPDILTYDCVYNMDKRSANYGKIDKYSVQIRIDTKYEKFFIHASRVIPFFGKKIPNSMLGIDADIRYWGISELQPVIDYLRDFSNAIGSTSSILMEFIIGKYKLSDLDEMLAKGGEERLQTRIQAIDMTKSVLHSVLLGTDEEYTRDAATVTGIADLLDRFMMNLSAVTEYPVTKLFGRSPAGLNATGENDLKNYYDGVRSRQKSNTRYIQNLVNLIASSKGLKGEYPWEWNPLFQLSEKDQAEVGRIKAETNRTQADADQRMMVEGVLLPEEVYNMRFAEQLGPKDFEMVEQEEMEKQLEKAEMFKEVNAPVEGVKEKEENGKSNPPGNDKKLPKNAK